MPIRNMNRSLVIILGALALGAAIFAGAFYTSQRACMMCSDRSQDSLGWLQTEYHLSDADMTRIRTLHEGYKPKCEAMCAQIAAKKKELEAALANGTNVTAESKARLAELAALQAQCQAQMLEHFMTVSQAMPPAAGRRYLAEMKAQTLGLREEMESPMSDAAGHEHHH